MSGSKTSRPEWAVAAVSALVVLGALGYTLVAGFSRTAGPPLIAVAVDSVVATRDGYLVLFTARNDGGETAAAVGVQGVIRRDTVTLEERQTTIDYVPVQAERRAGLLFTIDPRGETLDLHATGFDTP